MKINWILVGLFLINIVDAVINDDNNNEEVEFLNIIDRDSIKLPGLKRPFCNAFTGCGKKRNYIDSVSQDTAIRNKVNDSMISIPLKFYQILINNFNRKIRQNIQHKLAKNNSNLNDIADTKEYNNNEDYYFTLFKKQPIRKRYNL